MIVPLTVEASDVGLDVDAAVPEPLPVAASGLPALVPEELDDWLVVEAPEVASGAAPTALLPDGEPAGKLTTPCDTITPEGLALLD
jgi:hypothetical protein